jgi:SAM-dependent methyltransferase
MNDSAYWDAYYNENPPKNDPSDFAKSILTYLQRGKRLVDLGCGNGRDTLFFMEKGINVLGVDRSQVAIDALRNITVTQKNAEFLCDDFIDNPLIYNRKYDYFYSRFTIHSITENEQNILLSNVYNSLNNGGLFFIEVRGIHDDIYAKGENAGRNAYIYNNHFRRFIVNDELTEALSNRGFEILYNEESRGFAKYTDEDPIIIRIIARKYHLNEAI